MAMASCAPAAKGVSTETMETCLDPLLTVEGKQDVLLTTRDDLKQDNEVLSPFVFQTDCSMSGIGRCLIGWTICHY